MELLVVTVFENLRIMSHMHNTQVPSSDVITSLCGYSVLNETWMVFVNVDNGTRAIGDVK